MDALDGTADFVEAVRRQEQAEKAINEMRDARMGFVLTGRQEQDSKMASLKFLGYCALKLELEPQWENMPTAATDGKKVYFNPDFIMSLPRAQRMTVWAHEVMHCAWRHHTRMGSRIPLLWNVATDLAINQSLVEMGFEAIPDWMFPGQGPFSHLPKGESSEWYYGQLFQNPPPPKAGEGDEGDGGGKDGDGQPQPGKGKGKPGQGDWGVAVGDFLAPPDQATTAEEDGKWAENVAAAEAVARNCGTLPGSIKRMIDGANQIKKDPWALLVAFITRNAKDDYSWFPLNRRWLAQGFYFPTLASDQIEGLVIGLDFSGSIGKEDMQDYLNNLKYIGDHFKASMRFVYHDVPVRAEQEWKPGDPSPKLMSVGGGGTSHVPLFHHAMRMQPPPKALICFTDMCTQFPDFQPPFPVVWASTVPGSKAPFGEVVDLR